MIRIPTCCALALLATFILQPSPAAATPLITSILEHGTGLNANSALATSASSPSPSGTSAALVDEAFSHLTRTGEYTAVRTNDSTGLLTTSTAAGTTLRPFPSYLNGLEYVQIANENRTITDYSIDLTFATDVTAYLFMDNRINGTANNNSNPNTNDPILTGNLAWVLNDGWTRVNTGFMPNIVSSGAAQADYLGIDEGATVANEGARTHHDPGSGVGLNNFYSIYTKNFTAGPNVGVGKVQGINNTNIYGIAVVAVPEPSGLILGILGALAGCKATRRNR